MNKQNDNSTNLTFDKSNDNQSFYDTYWALVLCIFLLGVLLFCESCQRYEQQTKMLEYVESTSSKIYDVRSSIHDLRDSQYEIRKRLDKMEEK